MQPYQEEYLTNVREILSGTARVKPAGLSFEEYFADWQESRSKAAAKVKRNMELLRGQLFPALEHLPEADEEEKKGLLEFAGELLKGREEVDAGLFCQIHQAFLTMARLLKDRAGLIRELYWLGIGRNTVCNKLIGLELSESEAYMSQMRLCFTEAAAYLKYYDEIEDTETRGYILRSRANMSLGQFKSAGAKIQIVRGTLQIMQDSDYRRKEPNLPWERFVRATHQQMAASMSHAREHGMTPQDVEAVMESVYIVYQSQVEEALARGETPSAPAAFRLYAVEYYCGLDTLPGLLTKLEELMDGADRGDFSADGMFAMISVPAFYCQYLREYPELLPGRTEYLGGLYEHIMDYMEAFPEGSENETLFYYLRQLAETFVETDCSIRYSEFLQKLMIRFFPDLYIHSWLVGQAAAVLCGEVAAEEPDFFDDIEWIREVENPEDKRQKIVDYARQCGLFHDVGKLNFLYLYSKIGRQWLAEEYEMAQLHAQLGARRLSRRPSTSQYAEAALGHHRFYDGTHGYPSCYKRLESPGRQMVDVIALMDWLENRTDPAKVEIGIGTGFDQALLEALSQEGRRFSPMLLAWLREKRVVQRLRQVFAEGPREACRRLYEEEGGL